MDILITNITFFYLERRWERMNWSWQNLWRPESNEKFHLAIFGSPANTSFPGFVCFSSSSLIRRFPPRLGKWPSLVCVSFELGVIFLGSPLFLAVLGLWHDRGATTLNFGPISTKLGGTVRVIKKMTQKDNGPGPGRNYGETGVFTFGRKVVFGLKMGLTPKNHPKWHFPPWLFGQRHFFSLNNFFRLEIPAICL